MNHSDFEKIIEAKRSELAQMQHLHDKMTPDAKFTFGDTLKQLRKQITDLEERQRKAA